MRHTATALVLMVVTCLAASDARAWSKAGHMVTGAIAYYDLKANDRQTLDRVINILREHPFYEERWLPAITALSASPNNVVGDFNDTEGLFLFMYAARWPDDIRGDPDLHCGDCHFVNFRFRPTQPGASLVSIGGQLLDAFDGNIGIARGNGTCEERAMAISWVLHLTGDVHQPLHTAALVTQEFPQGDRGGTRFFIRATSSSQTISLHKFWDDTIMGSERFRSVNNRALGLMSRATLTRAALSNAELREPAFRQWARAESFPAARQQGYVNGTLRSGTSSNGRVLPQGYAATAQPVAERRAVLAGYRIADLLKNLPECGATP
ncbi:MAG: S1/P1 nuclease [Pyrinomonadaceae bacterium]